MSKIKYYANGLLVRSSDNEYEYAVMCGNKCCSCHSTYDLAFKAFKVKNDNLMKSINNMQQLLKKAEMDIVDDCMIKYYGSVEKYKEALLRQTTILFENKYEVVKLEKGGAR